MKYYIYFVFYFSVFAVTCMMFYVNKRVYRFDASIFVSKPLFRGGFIIFDQFSSIRKVLYTSQYAKQRLLILT